MQAGDVVAERFVVERFAARGGMGAVYRARDQATDEMVALKIVEPSDRLGVERFAREARILTELRHPGIVQYIAHGRCDAGLYLAMEWLEGEDLGGRLASAPLRIGESLRVAAQAAAALSVAHARQIVHRDVKPSNLFLVDWKLDRVKLLDFGVARLHGGEKLTSTGALVGTPAYMAPEQVSGDAIDARTDVFALGAVLFHCLTGRAPFVGSHAAEVIIQIVQQQAPRARSLQSFVPAALDDLVARMLAREPDERPQTVTEALAEMIAIDEASQATQLPAPARLTASERRVAAVVSASGAADEDSLGKAARAHGGEVSKSGRGDLLVTFVGQGLATDLVSQAARAALVMRRVAPGAALALVMGRTEITAGGIGSGLAERAAALARPGDGVRLDEVTGALLDARFAIAGDHEGLRLMGEKEGRPVRTVLGKRTPFVGRARELALLEQVFAECHGEGIARPVLVLAEAGMGKSRLREELLERLSSRGEPVEIWTAHGDPMRLGAPFGLLGDAIRCTAGIGGSEPAARRQQLLAERVARHLPAAQAGRVAEFLGELAGVPFPASPALASARRDPALIGEQMRAAWEQFLDAECRAQPVVLVLEDLQWGDLPTVKFVDSALRSLAERPFMVLGLARPEVHALFPGLFAQRGLQQVHLGPLPRRACERLVAEVLGAAAADVVGAMVERAGGNAFYLEELVRHAAEGKGGQLPETVLAMVSTRLESLDGEARRVLRAASVFGETFWSDGVRALLGGSPVAAQVDEQVRRLVEGELVIPQGRGRFAGSEELRFAHALVREAAYGMLTDEDRARGHQAAAVWLEENGEQDGVVIAEHLERAREPARAARWYRRAAEQALAAGDPEATIRRAQRAVSCGATGSELGEACLLLAAAYNFLGDSPLAEQASLDAMALLPAGSARWCTAVGEAAAASGKLHHVEELRRLAAILDGVRVAEVGGAQAIAFARAVAQSYLCREPEVGRALMARIGDAERRFAADPGVLAWVASARAFVAAIAGHTEDVVRELRAAATRFEQAGDAKNACGARCELSWGLLHLGAYEEAVAEVPPAIVEAERLGLRSLARMARGYLSNSLTLLGRLDEAEAMARAAVEHDPALNLPRVSVIAHAGLGAVLAARGDLAGAEAELRVAVAVGDAAYPPIIRAIGELARLLLARGHVSEAVELAAGGVARCEEERGMVPHEAVVRLTLAEGLHALGRLDEARATIGHARRRLLACEASITSEAYRQSFRQAVPEHGRVLALAREWLGESSA